MAKYGGGNPYGGATLYGAGAVAPTEDSEPNPRTKAYRARELNDKWNWIPASDYLSGRRR